MSETTYEFPWGKRVVRNGEVTDIIYERDERATNHDVDHHDDSGAGDRDADCPHSPAEKDPEPAKPWWYDLNPTSVRRTL